MVQRFGEVHFLGEFKDEIDTTVTLDRRAVSPHLTSWRVSEYFL